MPSRKTDNVTRVDIRIPNELYEEISDLAIHHFNAKIHHRSNKPEVTPTILELIKIGIAHLDATLPITDETVTDELQQAISELDSRLTTVEDRLSSLRFTTPVAYGESTSQRTVREQPTEYDSADVSSTTGEEKILSDMELSNILNVSNLLIRDYRIDGKKPRGQVLAKALTEDWEIRGEGWVKKS